MAENETAGSNNDKTGKPERISKPHNLTLPIHLRIVKAPEEDQGPATVDDLLKPGTIERLIANERIPHEIRVNSGRTRHQDPHGSLIAVPPPGTMLEDEAIIDTANPPRVSYWAPDGTLRGYARIIHATAAQAEKISETKKNILAKIKNNPK